MSEIKGTIPEKRAKDEIQFVNKSTKLLIATTLLIVILLSLLGGLLFAALILLNFPSIGFSGFIAMSLAFPIFYMIVTVRRNHIIKWIFGRIDHEHYLSFAIFWKRYPLRILAISAILGLFTIVHPISLLYAMIFLVLTMPPYFIFEDPLTGEGVIEVLFEGLFSNIGNFYRRQDYLKRISKIIEGSLELGNIEVKSNDLVYQFNRKLLETNDEISADLLNIKAWMLEKRRTCLDSLTNVIPDIKISPSTKESFLKRVLENPTPIQADLIKFFAILFAAVIVLLVRPELIDPAISLLKKLLGM